MKLVLTGATGFVGSEVLRQALDDGAIDELLVMTRRATGRTHPKLKEIVRSDFLNYAGIDFAGYDACIWALGVSQAEVSRDDYVRITLDYTRAGAAAMWAATPKLRFCFVSGRGADPTEQSRVLFAGIKGRAERMLSEMNPHTLIFRPAYIRPTARTGRPRGFARYFTPVGNLITRFDPDFSVDCDQLAACLLDVAKNGAAATLFDNQAIRLWQPALRA
jgi:uncharacterized protein YbjT (DUF2867 family)